MLQHQQQVVLLGQGERRPLIQLRVARRRPKQRLKSHPERRGFGQ